MSFDALLVLSFGGPEGPDDVIPFLENVVRGRPVPPARLEEVASQYMRFGGRSPINDQNRALVSALSTALTVRGRDMPVYFGNRNWHPFLSETLQTMRKDGVRRAATFVTSAYSSYSGCRQYLDDMEQARDAVGPGSPDLVKLRFYFDRPGFVGPLAAGLAAAREAVGSDAPVFMSAHSIPLSQAANCDYERQLRTTAALVAAEAGLDPGSWSLVFQSRSGPPHQPWLEPDLLEAIGDLPAATKELIVVPIGFVSDHMEVVYDLDRLANSFAADRGIQMVRTSTPGTDPKFVEMICQLLEEAEVAPFVCASNCCRLPSR